MKRAARFTQADIARALREARKVGMTIEITPDVIRIIPIDAVKQKLVAEREIVL